MKFILRVFGWASAAALLALVWWIASLGPPPAGASIDHSHVVLDRNGQILRAFAAKDGRWRLPARPEDVDSQFLRILSAYEDRRFDWHPGIDPLSMARAAFQYLTHGHVVSGGSTLTMQVARLLEPRRGRSLSAKLRQMVRAIQLERVLSKGDILALYLSLAPYGGNIEGVRAASLAYFGKEPHRLTLGEAALLVALPQSPEARRPDRHAMAAQRARDRVLTRAVDAGAVSESDLAHARAERVPASRLAMPLLAPHAADRAVAAEPDMRVHRLTIDAELQKRLEQLVRDRAQALGPGMSVALIAVDNESGEVRARVASAGYFDNKRAGQVDMTAALRSPGSTLKPFIYGLAFEDGFLHPETLIEDKPVRYGSYAPENFDLTFQGTVTVRRALQYSLNVPAIAVLDRLGTNRLTARLSQAGASLVLPKGEAPGLAMGLGGVGVSLHDLVLLYSGLARAGTAQPLIERADSTARAQRLLDPVAAFYVGQILLGTPPPDMAPRGRIAFKTGTSYGYRDAWAIGFDGKITIGIWAGRPDGVPVAGLTGRGVAAPILFDAFARLGWPIAPRDAARAGALVVSSLKLPKPLQRFRPASAALADDPPRIMFPPDGASLEAADAAQPGPFAMKISGGAGPLTVLVNGVPVPAQSGRKTVFFEPDGRGFVRLTVMDSRGAADSVTVRIQ